MKKERTVLQALWGNPFARTILMVGAGVLLVGGLVTYGVRVQVERLVREEALRDVEAIGPRILALVSPQDLAQPITGARYEELDRMIRDHVAGPNVVRLKLWNTSHAVVYSTLRSQVGDVYPGNEKLRKALQGRMTWEATREAESPQERAVGEVLEVYVPLAWEAGGKPAGAVEIYLPYAPYSDLLSSMTWAVLAAMLLAALTLPVSLCVLYRVGWAAIQREHERVVQREREVAALNRLLQRDLGHYFELKDRLLSLKAQVMQDPGFQPDAAPVSARDVWVLMQLSELGEFAANIMTAEEQKQPEGIGR